MRETRGFGWRGVTFCMAKYPVSCHVQSDSSCFTASSLFSLVRSEKVVETYVASVDADGDAGPLLDFLRHGGRCCLSLAMASYLGEKSEVLEKGRPLWCASAKTRDGKKRGLIGWRTSKDSVTCRLQLPFLGFGSNVSLSTYPYLNLARECYKTVAILSTIEMDSCRATVHLQ